MSQITEVLHKVQAGEPGATDALMGLVYEELRRIASWKMSQEKTGHTLQPTALVHEAWLKLLENPVSISFANRRSFYAAVAVAMRRILVDIARRKAAVCHGGEYKRRELSSDIASVTNSHDEVLAVHEALEHLESVDSQAAEVVKLHYFGGISIQEVAELLEVSRATAYRLWTFGRTFLKAAIENQ